MQESAGRHHHSSASSLLLHRSSCTIAPPAPSLLVQSFHPPPPLFLPHCSSTIVPPAPFLRHRSSTTVPPPSFLPPSFLHHCSSIVPPHRSPIGSRSSAPSCVAVPPPLFLTVPPPLFLHRSSPIGSRSSAPSCVTLRTRVSLFHSGARRLESSVDRSPRGGANRRLGQRRLASRRQQGMTVQPRVTRSGPDRLHPARPPRSVRAACSLTRSPLLGPWSLLIADNPPN
jgi:hypothetical protein